MTTATTTKDKRAAEANVYMHGSLEMSRCCDVWTDDNSEWLGEDENGTGMTRISVSCSQCARHLYSFTLYGG